MNIITRLKKDKKFRMHVIIAVIVFIFIINMIAPKKTFVDPAVCEAYTDSFLESHTLLTGAKDNCINAGCFLEVSLGTQKCVSCVADSTQTIYPEQCCSGKSKGDDIGLLGASVRIVWNSFVPEWLDSDKVYTCQHVPAEQQANANEREVASFIQNFGLFPDNAKMAYYITIIGGILMIVLVMAVVL